MGESSSDNDTAGEENAIAGELDRSDVVDVSNISNDDNYDAQFTANNLQDRGLNPSNFMSADNFAQTTQGGAPDPYALNDEAYASMGAANQAAAINQAAQNLAQIVPQASPVAQVAMQNIPSYDQMQNLAQMSFIPQGALNRNYNINYTPAVDLSFPQRIGNMFSRQYLGENLYNPVPSSISVEEQKNYSPVAFTPNFVNEKDSIDEQDNLADAASFALNQSQVDNLPSGLGNLPQSSGAGSAPITMQTAPTFDNSDFNFANSKAAENLQNMANITRGFSPIVDNVVGALSGASGTLDALNQGFVPEYDKDGNIIDVKDISFGSNQTEGYIGGQSPYLTNIYGNDADNINMNNNVGGDDNNQNQVVAPITNPLTGTSRCPDGYKFDEDLQMCRIESSRKDADKKDTSGELFFRQTALDNAPTNLPSGFDFDAANKRFTQGFAYNPSFYNKPMATTGFTPFSSFKPFNK